MRNTREEVATDIIYKALGGDKNPAAASLVASICWELCNNNWVFAKESELRKLESNSKYIAGLVEALKIADAVLSDANQRMKLFRDEPCDIPDIQHIAAISVEAIERASNNITVALNNMPEELRG